MAATSYELIPVNNTAPEYFDNLREVVDRLREQAYENFYIQVDTTYDHDKVVEKVKEEIWDVLQLDNVEDIY